MIMNKKLNRSFLNFLKIRDLFLTKFHTDMPIPSNSYFGAPEVSKAI